MAVQVGRKAARQRVFASFAFGAEATMTLVLLIGALVRVAAEAAADPTLLIDATWLVSP
jgi:hypothetical protein